MSIELSAVAPAATGAVKTGPNTASPAVADGVFRQIALAFASQSGPALTPEDSEAVLTGAEAPETDPEVDDEAVLEALLSSEEPVQMKSSLPKERAEAQSTEAPVEPAQHKAEGALLPPGSPAVTPTVQQDKPGPNGVKTANTTEIRSIPEAQKNLAKPQPLTPQQEGTKALHPADIVNPSDETAASVSATVEKKAIGTEQAQTPLRTETKPALISAQASASPVQRTVLPIPKTGEAERPKENATTHLEPLTPTMAEVQKQAQPTQIQAIMAKPQTSIAMQDISTSERLTDRPMPETTVQTPLSDTHRMIGNAAPNSAGMSPMAQPDMRQITGSLTSLIHAKADATTEIQLSPEELGRVRLVVSTQENGTTVLVSAERPETADYLRRNLDLLEKTCRDMGLDSADISYAESGHDDERTNPQGSAQQSDSPDNSISRVTAQKTASLSINLDRLDLRL